MHAALPSRLPVTIVGGYLGAGKTTLLNALLHGPHCVRLAVIVNDFGSVNIDAALIANRSGETINLTNGCICCSIGDSLALTLHDLAQRENGPEHVIIEASGVTDLGRLARLGASHPRLTLDSMIVVADAETVRLRAGDKYVGDLVRRQLAAADVIVLTKTDLIDAAEQTRLRTWLAAEVPGARVLDGRGLDLFTALLVTGGSAYVWPVLTIPPDASIDRHDEMREDTHARLFATWNFVEVSPLDEVRLRAAIAALPPAVIRAKGIVTLNQAPGHRFVLQLVGRRWSLKPVTHGAEQQDIDRRDAVLAGQSTIVCIGLADQLDVERLEALFAGTRADCRHVGHRAIATITEHLR